MPDKETPATPVSIIHLVVWSTAILVTVFICTLAALLFSMQPKDDLWEKVFTAFVTAGMSLMSFFFGLLVNTRTPAAPLPGTLLSTEKTVEVQQTQTPKT